ncbi:DUF2341 domain-containing protein, partial [Patescibacteria group bacterium]|nr:DUF2341 domain-containing protein [Patescibacteria group bacterium]
SALTIDGTSGNIAMSKNLAIGPVSSIPITATGGTITEVGGYRIHTFTTSGTFQVTAGNGNVESLVVAGGGGGGITNAGNGGGGGAGGFVTNAGFAVTPQAYAVVVGAGGLTSDASNGGNSSFSTISAIGGGGGGRYDSIPGSNGGSGGGAGQTGAAAANGGTGVSGQGFAGASNPVASAYGGGGGGGANAVGSESYSTNRKEGGYGGAGKPSSISGSSVTYAGGGAGSSHNTATAGIPQGGVGGGGNGHYGATAGTAGGANTGGGGGGGGENVAGGNGGSGIVIIRYLISAGGAPAKLAIAGTSGSSVQLFDIASSSGLSYLNVSANGNIGIGTSTPSALLSVGATAGSQFLVNTTGTVTNGIWNGTNISTQYGGTGNNWSSVATGSLPYFSSLGTMSTLSIGSNGKVLTASSTASGGISWETAAGGGGAWSALTTPTANTALSMGAYTTALTLANSTSAFDFKNSAGISALTIDGTNGNITSTKQFQIGVVSGGGYSGDLQNNGGGLWSKSRTITVTAPVQTLPNGYSVKFVATGADATAIFNGSLTSKNDIRLINTTATTTTALTSNITSTQTTIAVNSVVGFTQTGMILIDSERIGYSGITGTTLNNCIRGSAGTTAVAHTAGAGVTTVQEMERHIETFTSSNVTIWFKLKSDIPATTNDANYRLYYGNALAGAAPSNGENVFQFFDNFDDGVVNSDKWVTQQSGASTITEVNGYLQVYRDGVNASSIQTLNGITTTNFAVGYKSYTQTSGNFNYGPLIMDSNISDGNGFVTFFGNGTFNVYSRSVGAWNFITSAGAYTTATWNKYNLCRRGTEYSFVKDDSAITTQTITTLGAISYIVMPRVWNEAPNEVLNTMRIDDFYIRSLVVADTNAINGNFSTIGTEILSGQGAGSVLVNAGGTDVGLILNHGGTGKIVDFQRLGTSVFNIVNGGNVGIGTTSSAYGLVVGDGTTQKDIYVPKGGLCVDNNASGCPITPTAGTIYAVATAISAIDLAE